MSTQLPHTQLTHTGWAWQVWNLWHWAGSGGALGSLWTPRTAQLLAWQGWHLRNWAGSAGALGSTSRGMRGTWRHRLPLLMAGVALVALGWVWWRAWFPVERRGRHGCWRARRGTWRHQPPLCVVSVPLGDIALHFAWHAWHLATSTFTLRFDFVDAGGMGTRNECGPLGFAT